MQSIETRLARLAKTGDRGAFADLVELYKEKIYHLGYRMLGNRQEAEDITQETFLRVYRNLERYDESMKFSTWIYRIGTNLSIDRLRKRKATYSLDADVAGDGSGEGTDWYGMLASEEPTPEGRVLLSETQRRIRDAIETLPKKYKSVVILKYLHDMSLQEIGDVLDMPVTTVKTRVHRGREFLRKKLEHEDIL
ncbi:RNA polymerase sigma factor SigW [Paenibacillus sp. TRM 82003]|nr:RNA polymerase sigma factor SigW [Paenibacillus sp. TRM 82003]